MQLLSLSYSLGTFVISIAIVPIFLCYRRGRAHLWERFGFWDLPSVFNDIQSKQEIIWFHGASVGEVRGLVPVITALKAERPDDLFLVTSTSVTAFAEVEGVVDAVCLLPFDSAIWVRRVFDKISVKLFICGEIEIWPALYQELVERNIPVAIVNGRLSQKSFEGYRRLSFLFRPIFQSLALVLTADKVSVKRFEELGVHSSRITFVGNSKYDRVPSIDSIEAEEMLRSSFFSSSEPVLVLGSLWPGEEREWLKAIVEAFDSGVQLQIVVAPRHGEKNNYFADKLRSAGLSFYRRTELVEMSANERNGNRVVLLDTIGELEGVYSFATTAFIGGSMINGIGGHNPLEAAAYRVCVSMGPHREVVDEICAQLESSDALINVTGGVAVRQIVQDTASNAERLKEAGNRAYAVWQENSGAADRIVSSLSKELVKLD